MMMGIDDRALIAASDEESHCAIARGEVECSERFAFNLYRAL
jgi:hypothetical protein